MTITNKSLAKKLAKIAKEIEVKMWEVSVSGAKYTELRFAGISVKTAIATLGFDLQSDYTLVSHSVKQPYDLSQIKSEGEYPSKTVQIVGHTVKYWYEDGFENEICNNDPDFDDIQEAHCGGYREGEFNTFENETETHHYGYWEIVK